MNKFKLGAALLTLALSTSSVIFAANYTKSNEVDASVGNYTVDEATYYDSITATSGQQLAGQLHDLITTTHYKYTTYDDSGKNEYQKYTDHYYENDNPVSGYIYDFYTQAKWPATWDPNSGSTTGGYNREHVWCKSLSGGLWTSVDGSNTSGGADMHHIRPLEHDLNSTRNNNPYGEISNRDSYKVYANYGGNKTYAHGGYLNGGVFEPLDSVKGDVARILLYLYIHYNNYGVTSLFGSYATTNGSGSSSYFTSGSTLLPLKNIISVSSESAAIEMMLSWNESDPVDDIERRRNDQVAIYQGNRNPFIDNENFAGAIWGGESLNPSTEPTVNSVTVSPSALALNMSSTTTGNLTATVSVSNGAAQTVTWSSSNEEVATVNSSGVVTAVGPGTATIKATSTVNSAKYGTCTVTVTSSSGGGSGESTTISTTISTYASNHDWVNSTKYTSVALDSVATAAVGDGNYSNTGKYYTNGNDWRFYQSENATIVISVIDGYELDSVTFTFNVSNTGILVDSNSNTVTSGLAKSVSGTSATFTVSNSTDGVTNGQVRFTAISVTYHSTASVELSSISLDTTNATTEFFVGDTFSYSGLVVTANYSNGTSSTVTPTSVSSPNMSSAGEKTVTVTYTEDEVTKTNTYTITVVEPELSSISVDTGTADLDFYTGDTFSYSGITVTAHYTDGSSKEVTTYSVSAPDMSVAGEVDVTISYTEDSITKETSYGITIVEPTLTSISLNTTNVTTEFTQGDTFSYSGLVVTANFNNGSSTTVNPTSVTGYDMSTVGEQTVTVSYTHNEVTKTSTYTITVSEPVATSISATVSKTYTVGETITASDITVTENYYRDVADFTFSDYTFTYADASSGGALTYKTFTNGVTYGTLKCDLTVQVQRVAYSTPTATVSDTLNKAFTDNPSSYTSWTDKTANSDAIYAGHSNGTYSSIQLRSSLTNSTYCSGIITTASGGLIRNVEVTWESHTTDGRIVQIYGKNSAYTSPNDLFSDDSSTKGTLIGSIVYGTSTRATITGDYAYIGVRSSSGALYLTDITFTYECNGSETATNVANYIMYEDTSNQCLTKFSVAQGYFEDMSTTERATFMTSSDYVISTARDRLTKWATYLGKEIVSSNGDYVIQSANAINLGNTINSSATKSIVITVVVTFIGLVSCLGYLYIVRKTKEE